MKKEIEARLTSLRAEYESGRQVLAELDAKQAQVKETLLRISGAIQVLEEMLQNEEEADPAKPAAEPGGSAEGDRS